MSIEKRQQLKNKLEKLAWLSDSSIKLPGKFKIGIDSIVGLIPIIGDFTTAIISLYIMMIGLRAKVPKLVIFRMSLYIIWDTSLGAIPVVGDIFDMIFKSNERNVKLLNRYIDNPDSTEQSTRLWLVLLILFLICCMLTSLWLVWQLIQWTMALF